MNAGAAREAWMDIDLRALARREPVHFAGIGGAGMSALAELVLRSGGRVTGCDAKSGPVTDMLAALGAEIFVGHDAAHVTDVAAVVCTSAMPSDHPELAAARAAGIPVLKRAQALGALVNRGTLLAVAGTHGKTTTTAMTAAILTEASLNPTSFVGGTVGAWGSGLRAGSETLFVVEADEYDRSFFTLRPDVVVLTSVEPDHLDVYGTAEAVDEAFRDFVDLLPEQGLLAACADDQGALRVLEHRGPGSLGYGTSDTASLRAVEVQSVGRGSRFTVRDRGADLGSVDLGAPGLHNVRNALGALAAARHAGADFASAQRALAAFTGVDRRLQELGTAQGVTVIDDYAHHPTEITASIEGCRAAYPGRPVVAVFQPHLFTRTRDFADAFGHALAGADAVWVTDVYPARETPIPGVTGERVAATARTANAAVEYVEDLDALADLLVRALRPGDVCLVMGAGDIDRVAHEAILRLRPVEA
jgi:UDP-N-acetylmuramate--alanine ligase